jgi:hypothetical protein
MPLKSKKEEATRRVFVRVVNAEPEGLEIFINDFETGQGCRLFQATPLGGGQYLLIFVRTP